MGDTVSTGSSTSTSKHNDSDILNELNTLRSEVKNMMTKKVVITMADLPSGLVTSKNFASTFSQQATDSSISQELSMGGKVGDAVSTWMDAPDNQAKIQNMVKTGANEVTAQQFNDLKASVESLQKDKAGSGSSSSSGGSGSDLTFNAAREVGCVRWNWFHNKNTKKCYAMDCDPNKTDYPDGTCFTNRSSCTDEITPVRVIDGKCYASLTQDCKESDCQQSCPAGDDAIVMPTQCAGPLILQDIYTAATPAPEPLLQNGAFQDLTMQDLTVQKTLTVGEQTGDASGGSTTGKLVVNGDASLECPACCLPPTSEDCPINYPYSYTDTKVNSKGQNNMCCSVPASGGTADESPSICSGGFMECPKGSNCHAIQTLNKSNPCPDCAKCAKLSASYMESDSNLTVTKDLIVGNRTVLGGTMTSKLMNQMPAHNVWVQNGGMTVGTFDGWSEEQDLRVGKNLTTQGDLTTKGNLTVKGRSNNIDGWVTIGGGLNVVSGDNFQVYEGAMGGKVDFNLTGNMKICTDQERSNNNSDSGCYLEVPRIKIFNDAAGVTSKDADAPLYFSGMGDGGKCYITSPYGCQSPVNIS